MFFLGVKVTSKLEPKIRSHRYLLLTTVLIILALDILLLRSDCLSEIISLILKYLVDESLWRSQNNNKPHELY